MKNIYIIWNCIHFEVTFSWNKLYCSLLWRSLFHIDTVSSYKIQTMNRILSVFSNSMVYATCYVIKASTHITKHIDIYIYILECITERLQKAALIRTMNTCKVLVKLIQHYTEQRTVFVLGEIFDSFDHLLYWCWVSNRTFLSFEVFIWRQSFKF